MIATHILRESFGNVADATDTLVALVEAAFGTDAIAQAIRDEDEDGSNLRLILDLRTDAQADAVRAMIEAIMNGLSASDVLGVAAVGAGRVIVDLA